ncbi:MAG: Asp-tRNA(Asn)/Glu-tRNA(Gln) amidotransferase subunit GatC, partial [Oscillospiraceae bacterium]|nr:Asp-tRNA(Asn)/Glu-tRNA(Gln) amidotransferase subunit GatC [Oscillospiraceae bacterium]
IIDFANEIAGADLSQLDTGAEPEAYPLRADEAAPSLPPETILRNAGEARDGFFVARRLGGRS